MVGPKVSTAFLGSGPGKIGFSGMGNEKIQDLIGRRLATMENNGVRQKIVPVEKIEKYIEQGWEFVATLPTARQSLGFPPNFSDSLSNLGVHPIDIAPNLMRFFILRG